MEVRVGQGLDVHAFCEGNHVMLGGVRIPHQRGLAANSDGDVVLHALCDALLGAGGLGDIGHHFPPTDLRWADVDSRILLRRVRKLLVSENWSVNNVDVTVICEQPRIGSLTGQMRENVAADLHIDEAAVSIKATTTEQLGFCGRGEGIAASAVVLIRRTGQTGG